MTNTISDNLLLRLSEFVNSRTGLHFPREKWRDLKRNIAAASPDLGFDDTTACIEWLLSARLTREQKDTLVGHLTIGETFFFRDKFIFQALKERFFPAWLGSHEGRKKEITFWSAGCCTGEEPYSIAILIDQMKPAFKGWEVTIIGTDINARFLKKAREGTYSRWSFRNTPDRLIDEYFKKTGKNRFEISAHIRKMVRFSQLNLVQKDHFSPPGNTGAMDVIFCRNVLMYLSPDMREKVIQRLASSLIEEGWLIVSPSETPFVQAPRLHSVRFPGAIFHRKGPPRRADKETAADFRPRRTASPFSTRPITPDYQGRTSGHKPTPPLPALPKKEKRKKPEKDLYQEALNLYANGRYDELAEKMEKLLISGKMADDTLFVPEQKALLARAYANMGQLDEAERWCKQAIQAEKLHPDYYYLLATIYQEQGLVEEPIKSLGHAIYLDPGLVMAYFLLGHLTREQGKPGESKKYFANALDLLSSMDPGEVVPHSDGLTAESLRKTVGLMIVD
jgi:chemotaxis protein methyltransferase CheR